MNTPADVMPESAPGQHVPAPMVNPGVRPLYWSVRRELWENRSIYIAPLAAAAFLLFGYVISLFSLPERRRAVLLLDAAKQHAAVMEPYNAAAMVILAAGVIVGAFYCLDALYGERRDRSILFWKSLPVSDLTTVLSKAAVPLVVLPTLSFVLIVTTQIIMFLLGSMVLLMNDLSVAMTWMHLKFFQQTVILFYGLITLALWHAPVYGWLLLVSGWARRAPFLWAVLPLVGISVLERMAFGSSHVGALLESRLSGGIDKAFNFDAQGHVNTLAQLTPGNFFGAPGLWLGLACAAAFLAAAVWLRREREPL